ncbi:hypothetical protein GCM10023082_47020 [Streptomyces tremellae]|uniref:Secreted protein n=1 Tax=Streptomyces tremellae TaxID=1124239 RepID=A0ABP7FQ67_9ACTN
MARTRAAVALSTSLLVLMTRETVVLLTPASRATSAIVTRTLTSRFPRRRRERPVPQPVPEPVPALASKSTADRARRQHFTRRLVRTFVTQELGRRSERQPGTRAFTG